ELHEGSSLRLEGFDIAVQPQLTRQALLEYVQQVAPDEVGSWSDALPLAKAGVDFLAAADSAEKLRAQIDTDSVAYQKITGVDAWLRARRNADNLSDGYRFLALYSGGGDFWAADAQYREPGLIRNTMEILGRLQPGERVLLVSADEHCGKSFDVGA